MCNFLFPGSSQSLSAVEAIVAKYLSPKISTISTKKNLIKRAYGVSVTGSDVFAENIIKQKKKIEKMQKKTPTAVGRPTINRKKSPTESSESS